MQTSTHKQVASTIKSLITILDISKLDYVKALEWYADQANLDISKLDYVKALEWYADQANYIGEDLYSSPGQDFPYGRASSKVEKDGGKKARLLLGIK